MQIKLSIYNKRLLNYEISYFEGKLNKKTAPITRGYDAVIAFVNDDIDKTVADVKSAGYEVFVEPKDITVPFNAKIAFCFGPLGEQVEFFEQK